MKNLILALALLIATTGVNADTLVKRIDKTTVVCKNKYGEVYTAYGATSCEQPSTTPTVADTEKARVEFEVKKEPKKETPVDKVKNFFGF